MKCRVYLGLPDRSFLLPFRCRHGSGVSLSLSLSLSRPLFLFFAPPSLPSQSIHPFLPFLFSLRWRGAVKAQLSLSLSRFSLPFFLHSNEKVSSRKRRGGGWKRLFSPSNECYSCQLVCEFSFSPRWKKRRAARTRKEKEEEKNGSLRLAGKGEGEERNENMILSSSSSSSSARGKIRMEGTVGGGGGGGGGRGGGRRGGGGLRGATARTLEEERRRKSRCSHVADYYYVLEVRGRTAKASFSFSCENTRSSSRLFLSTPPMPPHKPVCVREDGVAKRGIYGV